MFGRRYHYLVSYLFKADNREGMSCAIISLKQKIKGKNSVNLLIELSDQIEDKLREEGATEISAAISSFNYLGCF